MQPRPIGDPRPPGRGALRLRTTPTVPAIRDQIAWLHLRILGEFLAADSEEVDLTLSLYDSVYTRTGSASTAWTVVISALLQDPRMMFY